MRVNASDLQRIFEDLPGLFLVVEARPPFAIVAASRECLRATHTDAGIIGYPLFEAFPDNPADPGASGRANLTASFERVRATRKPDAMEVQRYDVRVPERDGGQFQERHWAPVNAPILGADGEVRYIAHRIEEAAAKANREAVHILESITEGFFTLDRQWRFDYVNQEAHRILGRTQDDLTGKVLWQEYPGLEGTEFELSYQRTMHEREKSSFTAYYAGHGVWYDVTTFPAPGGVSVYFRDVTERKRMEEERQQLVLQSEQQRRIYETALDSTPDFVYVFDLEHRVIYANEALVKTWGIGDARGKRWMELGYEQWHADMHDREIEQVVRTRAPIRGEIPFTGTNGTRVYDYIFAPVFGAGGEVVAVAGTTRDVTERQAAEQAVRDHAGHLAESDRIKDEFLATLSHELRNPLAPLRNAIELLRRTEGPESRAAPVHAIMQRQVNHLVRLVDDLLEVSRISRGAFSLRKEIVPLAAIVRNAVETSSPVLEAAGHKLDVQLPEPSPWLEGDPVRLAQILANLLDNSAKYTEDGGHVVVRAWSEDGYAMISVRDDGVGIPAEDLSKMFDMFSRGDRDSARSQGGLGIGLALSRRLAEMHGGSLEARSEGRGAGCEFIVRLPLAPAPKVTDAEPAAAAPDLARARVLVVDDNGDAADSLAMILDLLGAQVRVARSGAEALDLFPSYRPSVVLLDIGMPGMNGYEVARTLRDRYPDAGATLVALTGWGQDEDRRRAREAGFDHHFVKPAPLDSLQQLLASLA